MQTTENTFQPTDFPDDVDLKAEYDRVDELRKFHENRMIDFSAADDDRWKAERELANLAEHRGNQIYCELNARGFFDCELKYVDLMHP